MSDPPRTGPISIFDRLQKDKYFRILTRSTDSNTSAIPSSSQAQDPQPANLFPTNPFPLLSLPPELVIRVIREVIALDVEMFLSQRPHSYALAHTCRWLNAEVSRQFWQRAVPLNAVGDLGMGFEFWPHARGLRWGHGDRAERDVWCRILHVVARNGEVFAVKCALEPWKDLSGLGRQGT